ncbi:MAG0110 family membrane protein [Mycoplasmopsis columboralis]|uniref:Inhibitor of apoptosis-promoting Bax1 n=1 Tax=Mycoplasmopsis columboralis TaxID=171282 RepID=A0A449B6C6_9BACT|nr:hypothetical protein [Mycoplasmopsis columboralis]VEU76102.1 Uncharacterised protein [Mycoplasmopsis columboralis]
MLNNNENSKPEIVINSLNHSLFAKKYFSVAFVTFAFSLLVFFIGSLSVYFGLDALVKNGTIRPYSIYVSLIAVTIAYFIVSLIFTYKKRNGFLITSIFWIVAELFFSLIIGIGLNYGKSAGLITPTSVFIIFAIPTLIMIITGALSYFNLIDLTKIKKLLLVFAVIIIVAIIASIFTAFLLPYRSNTNRILNFAIPVLLVVFVSLATLFTWNNLIKNAEEAGSFEGSDLYRKAIISGVRLFVDFATLVYYVLSIFLRRR